MILKPGLYASLPDRGSSKTYGLQAINSPEIYDALKKRFSGEKELHFFFQGDSFYMAGSNKSFLFVEFFGERLDDDSFLELVERISEEIGYPIVDFI